MSDLVKRLRDEYAVASRTEAADHIEQLEAQLAAAEGIIQWYLENDETNTGDYPMPDYNYRTWNEMNAFWIDGNNRAEAWLAAYREARK